MWSNACDTTPMQSEEHAMGWGRTLLLGDIGNRLDIDDVERDLRNLQREVQGTSRKDLSQDEAIQLLTRENGQLKLFLASLIRTLVAKHIISREELTTMVNVVDGEDGAADGQYAGEISG